MAEKRIFTYDQALATLPRVRQLTQGAVRQIEALYNQVGSREEGESRRAELEQVSQQIVRLWTDRITALGCEVKGLWLVDWDSGHGYYCWRYPEPSITHFHGYEEGFAGRVPIV
ncbi:MAG TPA: DUF2203 domain-containing protein [Thermoanaerobaculia bacterium]|nr:DUF2203 domain-containing protein [Thermoanaerobaculia bacterium]